MGHRRVRGANKVPRRFETQLIFKSTKGWINSVVKQSFSCDCGNVMECIAENDMIKPKYRSISGQVRLRCNDCDKEHEVFLKHNIAKFVGATPSFKENPHFQK